MVIARAHGLHGKTDDIGIIHLKAGHVAPIARRGILGVPSARDLLGIPLIQHGIKDGLPVQPGREGAKVCLGDQPKLGFADRTE